jgi:hypothetical protein
MALLTAALKDRRNVPGVCDRGRGLGLFSRGLRGEEDGTDEYENRSPEETDTRLGHLTPL